MHLARHRLGDVMQYIVAESSSLKSQISSWPESPKTFELDCETIMLRGV